MINSEIDNLKLCFRNKKGSLNDIQFNINVKKIKIYEQYLLKSVFENNLAETKILLLNCFAHNDLFKINYFEKIDLDFYHVLFDSRKLLDLIVINMLQDFNHVEKITYNHIVHFLNKLIDKNNIGDSNLISLMKFDKEILLNYCINLLLPNKIFDDECLRLKEIENHLSIDNIYAYYNNCDFLLESLYLNSIHDGNLTLLENLFKFDNSFF